MDSTVSPTAGNTPGNPFISAALITDGLEIGLFTVTGKDAGDFLHRQLSNEVRHLPIGSGAPVCLLDREGKIQLYFTLWKSGTGYSAIVPGAQRHQFIPLLDRILFREEICLDDQTLSSGLMILAGARAVEILRKAGAAQVPESPFQSSQFNCGGSTATLYRMNWLEWPCLALVCPSEQPPHVAGCLEEAGAIRSSMESFHSYRIEKGSPWPGCEVDDSMVPFECGLEETLSFTKGCYVGQEIISRIHNLGKPPRILRGLVIEAGSPPERGTLVCHEKVEVGRVLSSAWSEDLGKPIATISIKIKHSTEGTPVMVGDHSAVVSEFPLIKRVSS